MFNASVDSNGNVEWTYSFSPLKKGLDFSNNVAGNLTWNEILEDLQSELNKTAQKNYRILSSKNPSCGAFKMEIRVWDRDAESIQDITEL